MSPIAPSRSPAAGRLALLVLAGTAVGPVSAQTISVSEPLVAFTGIARGPNPPGQLDSITNTGSAPLVWRIRNLNQLARWLVVTPASGDAPATLGIGVNTAGLPAGRYSDTVEVASNDPVTPVQPIFVVLSLTDHGGGAAAAPALATYQIALEFIGISGHHVNSAADCQAPVDSLGYDILVGTVVGDETPAPDEDVVYVGTLRRSTAMDFCELRGPTEQPVDCRASLTGWTAMDVEITVYGGEGRGAYVKADPVPGNQRAAVNGDCERGELARVQSDYLSTGDGGGSPNGQPIEDPRSLLFASSLARLRVGTLRAQPPASVWTLRVLRRVP